MNILGNQVKTRGGLFGPGGYGGGIFDGSGMGFGGLGQYEQAAAGVQGFGAIGQDDDFMAWHAETQSTYGPGYTSPTAVLPEGPGAPTTATVSTTTSSVPYPWDTYSSATYSLQGQVNDHLYTLNKQPIAQDGYLGPETCGAIDYLKGLGISILKPNTCQGSDYDPTLIVGTPDATATAVPATTTTTTPATTTPTTTTPATTPTTTTPGPTVARAGMSPAVIGLGVAALVGIGIFAATRKRAA